MKYSIFVFSLFVHFATGQEVHVVKAKVGELIQLPTVASRGPASYTFKVEPDNTIITKRSEDGWRHENGYTARLLQYDVLKIGITYMHVLLHSNTQPDLGSKWFIIKVE